MLLSSRNARPKVRPYLTSTIATPSVSAAPLVVRAAAGRERRSGRGRRKGGGGVGIHSPSRLFVSPPSITSISTTAATTSTITFSSFPFPPSFTSGEVLPQISVLLHSISLSQLLHFSFSFSFLLILFPPSVSHPPPLFPTLNSSPVIFFLPYSALLLSLSLPFLVL